MTGRKIHTTIHNTKQAAIMQTKNIFEIHNTQQEKIRITKGRKFTNLDRRTRRGSEEETTKKSNQPWRGRRRGGLVAMIGPCSEISVIVMRLGCGGLFR